MLLGPAFVWLLLLANDDKDALGLKKCPHCAEWVKKEAKVCKFCHKDLAPAGA
jgi:hypothetical protein